MKIIWIDGAFGIGKSAVSNELHKLLFNSKVFEFDSLQAKYHPNTVGDIGGQRFPEAKKYLVDGLVTEINKYAKTNPEILLIIPIALITDYCNEQLINGLTEYSASHFILDAPKNVIISRIKAQPNRDCDLAMTYLNTAKDYLDKHYPDAERIDTSNITANEVASIIGEIIKNKWQLNKDVDIHDEA